jgi:ureidoglycolate lyase
MTAGTSELTKTTEIETEVLTAEAFALFGEVVAHGGECGRWFVNSAFQSAEAMTPKLWVNRLARLEGDSIAVNQMERHPYSAQTCVPLGTGHLLIVVADAIDAGDPDFDNLKAFVAEGVGVTYRPGVWHHGSLALDRTMEAVFVMSLTGRQDDTEVRVSCRSIRIRLPQG